jgi:hypothetical protein
VADGELGLLDRNRVPRPVQHDELDRHRFHRQLAYIARERGYQPGWAAHKYREKFGGWPAVRNPDPLPPDEAVRAWVRSRQIAWAKAQQKAGAA